MNTAPAREPETERFRRSRASATIADTPSIGSGPVTPGLVSVVIPCYNYGHYLAGCVESVVAHQGRTPVEVVIVDDESTDDTEQVGRDLARRHRGVTYVRHEQNLGHIRTYNHGLSLVRGEFVALLSADDALTPGSLTRAATVLTDHPDVAVVYGPVEHVYDASTDLRPQRWADESSAYRTTVLPGRSWSADVARSARNPIASPEAVVRTALHRSVGGYRPDLPHSGDLEMWLRLSTVGDVARIHGPAQAVRRMHQANMSDAYTIISDLEETEEAFGVFDAYACLAWPSLPSLLPRVHSVLARRALRLALDAVAAGADDAQVRAKEALAFDSARRRHTRLPRPGARLLEASLAHKPWAQPLLTTRTEAVRLVRRVKPSLLSVRSGIRSLTQTRGPARAGDGAHAAPAMSARTQHPVSDRHGDDEERS